MFGGDDDDDFNPAPSSKLASLFGFGNTAEKGNASLIYTAPKQPKKSGTDAQTSASTATSTAQTISASKLSIIVVKAVHTFKLEDKVYVPQGKLGAAVLGNTESRVFQLLIYKGSGKHEHIMSTKITPKFQYTVQLNNYASFYDDQLQNWSIMFDNTQDAVDFSKEVALARANSQDDPAIQTLEIQDMVLGEDPAVAVGDSLEIRYTARPLTACQLGEELDGNLKAEKPLRIKVKKGTWEEGLIGVTKACKRLIILPSSLAGPWTTQLPANSSLALEVDVERVKVRKRSRDATPSRLSSLHDSGDSNVDSSADDTSIKARGASISEALTNSPKTNKASLISRMARMGQATLPLKGAIICNPSDSEETEEESTQQATSSSSTSTTKPSARPRSTKNRSLHTPVAHDAQPRQVTPQLAVYQPVNIPWQQQQQQQQFLVGNCMAVGGRPQQREVTTSLVWQRPQYQHPMEGMVPLMPQQAISAPVFSAPAVASPTTVPSPESHLAVYMSETRTQGAEVRMAVAKVADKVDQVLTKLEQMSPQRQLSSTGALDASVVIASIQRVLAEKEQLQAELTEVRAKLEQQNDKVYHLLNTNQRFLEQHRDSSDHTLSISLQQEKVQLLSNISEMQLKMESLQLQTEQLTEKNNELLTQENSQKSKLKVLEAELENRALVIQEKDMLIKQVEEKLCSEVASRESLEETVSKLKEEVESLISCNKQLETDLVDLQNKAKDSEDSVKELKKLHQVELEQLQNNIQNPESISNLQHKMEEEYLQKSKSACEALEAKHSAAVEKLQHECNQLTNKVQMLQLQNQDTTTATAVAPVVDEVKKVMNIVYRTLHTEFELGRSYDAAAIRQTLMDTIRDVTLQFLEMKKSLDNEAKQEKSVSYVQIGAVPPVEVPKNQNDNISNSQKENIPPNEELTSEGVSDKKSAKNLPEIVKGLGEGPNQPTLKSKDNALKTSPEMNISLKQHVHNAEVTDTEKEDNASNLAGLSSVVADQQPSLGPTGDAGDDREAGPKNSRDSSLDRGWKPRPPTPPLFDDDDEDDDWLN